MPIIILGQRSGTSMVTRMLQLCGVDLGDEADLGGPNAANREGYWEHLELQALNDRVLGVLGASWDHPPAPDADWTSPALRPFHDEAAAFVASFAGREPWGFKDPRTSLTLPFWQPHVPDARYVLSVRHPLDVARSLDTFFGTGMAEGLALWTAYQQSVLTWTRTASRHIVWYDAVLSDPLAELTRLVAALALPADRTTIERAAATVRRDLRHYVAPAAADGLLSEAARTLLMTLEAEGGRRPVGEDTGLFDYLMSDSVRDEGDARARDELDMASARARAAEDELRLVKHYLLGAERLLAESRARLDDHDVELTAAKAELDTARAALAGHRTAATVDASGAARLAHGIRQVGYRIRDRLPRSGA